MSELSKPNRLAFVIPYLGSWPKWSRLFFESCRANPCVAIFVVCETPPGFPLPANVHVVRMSRAELIARLERATGLKLNKMSGHKLCDFRPFFGLAFQDILGGYEFWGYCDVDMMFGDLKKLLTDDFLDSLDGFSAHHGQCVGHFTIMRNTGLMNCAGFQIESWKQLCMMPRAEHVDEERFLQAVSKNHKIRWERPKHLEAELASSFAHCGVTFTFFGRIADLQTPDSPVVSWKNGLAFYQGADGRHTEVLYIHFMAIKHWWHWLFFRQNSPMQSQHHFSRIGYGGVSNPAELAAFPWRQLYAVQTVLALSKSEAGRLLRQLLPGPAVEALRRRLKI